MMFTHSAEETQNFALKLFKLLKCLKGYNVLALVGDLGSGKTTFTQGIASALGISQRVVSPTFVLMRKYEIKNQNSKIKNTNQKSKILRNSSFDDLYHFDLYRLQSIEEVKELGVEEIWQDPNNLVIIEWAEKVREILPENTVWLEFRYTDEKTREILVSLKLKVKSPKLQLKV